MDKELDKNERDMVRGLSSAILYIAAIYLEMTFTNIYNSISTYTFGKNLCDSFDPQQYVVAHSQVIEQLKVLEYKTEVVDAKGTAFSIRQLCHRFTGNLY